MTLSSFPDVTENSRAGVYISSDHGTFSRDIGLFAPNKTGVAGLVLGATGASQMSITSAAAAPGNTGNGAITAAGSIIITDAAIDGVYEVKFGSSTEFELYDPNGIFIGRGAVGAPFVNILGAPNVLGFTITAGGTAFAQGDSFQIVVLRQAISGEYFYPLNPSATDGTQNARAILFDDFLVANSAATPVTITARKSEVNPAELTWPSGATTAQIEEWTNQLAEYNIILRAGGDF